MNPWIPQSPEHEASPDAVAAREAEYDRIAPRWREQRQARAGGFGWNTKEAVFSLDHAEQTARLILRCWPETHSNPYIGVPAVVDMPEGWHGTRFDRRDADFVGCELRLMGAPYNGQVIYRIVP